MNQKQWQEVESIIRREQQRALQHMNTYYYNELGEILNNLYPLAHCSENE